MMFRLIFKSVLLLSVLGIISVVSALPTTDVDDTLPLNRVDCGKRYYEKDFPVESRLFEHPWLVQLGYKRGDIVVYIFQGLLIHSQYVLTTVHVAQFEDFGQLTFARLGEFNTSSDRDCEEISAENKNCAAAVQDILVDAVIPHPRFNMFEQSNNIALVRLRSQATVNGISVALICLNQDPDVESPFLYTASWCGRRDTGLSKIPKQYQMAKITPQSCQERMPGYTISLSDGMFCVVFGDKHNKPQDDKQKEPNLRGGNGGPIFTVQEDNKIYLIGLVSYGPSYPAKLDQPHVITPVAPYYDWLTETIQSDIEKKQYKIFE